MHRADRWEPSMRVAGKTEQIGEIAQQAEAGTVMTHVQSVARNEEVLASVMVPRVTSTRDITVRETAMQGLALDARHPVTLELAATASNRPFLLSALSALFLQSVSDPRTPPYPP